MNKRKLYQVLNGLCAILGLLGTMVGGAVSLMVGIIYFISREMSLVRELKQSLVAFVLGLVFVGLSRVLDKKTAKEIPS